MSELVRLLICKGLSRPSMRNDLGKLYDEGVGFGLIFYFPNYG